MTPIKPALITVIGVGGGGSNAVNHMFTKGIDKVNFVVCNTDKQALLASPIPHKIQLGAGLGAGNTPQRATIAAEDTVDHIREILEVTQTKMLFITAGMGGGTGTGASPVIAKVAKEMDILTIAVVSIPIESEGRKRLTNAVEGVDKLSKLVDSIIIINTEHTEELYGNLPMSAAYDVANEMLRTAVKSMSDIINQHLLVNVDFEDAKTVLKDSGLAVMGTAEGEGEGRAVKAIEEALLSPLLHHKDIQGAQNVLLKITSSSKKETTLRESKQILQYIQERSATGNSTDVIWGAGIEDSLDERLRVTIIATGFKVSSIMGVREFYKNTFHDEERRMARFDPSQAPAGPSVISIGDDSVEAKPVVEIPTSSDDDFNVVANNGQNESYNYGRNSNNNEKTNRDERNYRNEFSRTFEQPVAQPQPVVARPAAQLENDTNNSSQSGEINSAEQDNTAPKVENPAEYKASQMPKMDDIAHKTIYEMSEDEIDLIPAWKRNPVKGFIDDDMSELHRPTSIVLQDDSAYQPPTSTKSLFE